MSLVMPHRAQLAPAAFTRAASSREQRAIFARAAHVGDVRDVPAPGDHDGDDRPSPILVGAIALTDPRAFVNACPTAVSSSSTAGHLREQIKCPITPGARLDGELLGVRSARLHPTRPSALGLVPVRSAPSADDLRVLFPTAPSLEGWVGELAAHSDAIRDWDLEWEAPTSSTRTGEFVENA